MSTANRPTVPEVIDLESGRIRHVSEIFSRDDSEHHRQRMADELNRIRGGLVRYHCPLCHSPLVIRARKSQTYYFRHPDDPTAECPYRYENDLTPEQINAIKYDGAKESARHRQIKRMLELSLDADRDVEPNSVQIEKTVKIREGEWTQWRKPDVQARFRGDLFAFEIQLSTTFLTVIAGRRSFYQKQGGLLFWIFDQEYLRHEEMRFTERDVYYNNNSNLFYLTAETVAHSQALSECRLMCRWEEPVIRAESILLEWKEKEVSLSDLKFDFKHQRVYYYDHDLHVAEAKKVLDRRNAQQAAAKLAASEAKNAELDAIEYERARKERAIAEQRQKNENAWLQHLNSLSSEPHLAPRFRTSDEILKEQKREAEKFKERVLFTYCIPPAHIDTAENFGNFWIRAGLEPDPESYQEVVWDYYHKALALRCGRLETPLSPLLPKDYRHLLCALYSLREGVVIGTNLGNLRALENLIFSKYRWFYRHFAYGIRCYKREEELRSLVKGSTCANHIADYKANLSKPGYIQHHGLDPLVNYLFPELRGGPQ